MKYLFICILFIFSLASYAQDLNARVQILSPQLQSTNKRLLDVLETSIRDFLNNRKWSTNALQAQERIDCNFVITVTEWDGSSNFKAEAQIQSSRPVFNTAYNSTILNITDKDFDFAYAEGQPLDFSDENYIGNLTSLLGFYAYVITGFDFDTFSKFGGTAYFSKGQVVLNNSQNAPYKGWKGSDGLRNRFWLLENLNNKAYYPIREAMYEYHRQALDIMSDNKSKGLKLISNLLPQFQKIDKQKQGSMLNQIFFTAKADELVNILGFADPQEKMKAFNILVEIDPANSSKYEALKKSR
ncbi:MAG TPA: DUF4835 family protein [Sphingobacteriaceae bacterium]|nr:DUF4835 family protein [Sphingobacteriaceae bacterium]